MTLTEYLRDAAARPFVWGQCDCCLFAADWVQAKTGIDPASAMRGEYHSELGAREIIQSAGSLRELVGHNLNAEGFFEAHVPQEGDIGLLRLPIHGETVGIRTSIGRWAFKTKRGIFSAAVPDLIAACSL